MREAERAAVASAEALGQPMSATDRAMDVAFWSLRGYPTGDSLGRAVEQLSSDTSVLAHFFVGAIGARGQRWSDAARERRWLDSASQQARIRGDSTGGVYITALVDGIRGFEAASHGDRRAAIQALAAADRGLVASGNRLSPVLITLERLLVDAGQFREAERYLTATDYTMFSVRVPGEFYLAQAYEGLGDREKAKLHYANFVRWWQDCDPELRPFRAEGERALAHLAREPGTAVPVKP
jgi:hypothetical protein